MALPVCDGSGGPAKVLSGRVSQSKEMGMRFKRSSTLGGSSGLWLSLTTGDELSH